MGSQVFSVQNSFTLGELSERLHARTDFAGYYKGAKRMRNMLPIPQGGARRRFGLRYQAPLTGGTTKADFTLSTLEYLTEAVYNVVFVPGFVNIYLGSVLKATVATPYITSDIPNLSWTQTEDTLLVFSGTNAPYLLQRDPTDDTMWTFVALVFTIYPVFDFTNNYPTITFTPSATTGNITLTASAAIFSTDYVGGLFNANNGSMRITGFTDSTHVTGYVVTEFDTTDPIIGTGAYLAEPAFSATRGWPSCGTFYNNRLVLANTSSLPQGVFISRTNLYYNFDTASSNDDYGITVLVRSDRANVVQHVLGSTSLFIFTNRGIFTDKGNFGEPITPSAPWVVQQNKAGSSPVQPVELDNQMFYVDYGGKIVRSGQFDVQRQGILSDNISVLSPELIRNPVDSASLQNPEIDDGQFLLLVNDDGTLATYTSLITQNVKAWSLQDTPGASGQFIDIDGSLSELWVITQREIDGNTVFYLEQIDFDLYTDCATTFSFGSPTTSITGLEYLEGEEVQVRGDDYVLGRKTVTDGAITLERACIDVEVGLGFSPLLITMPLNIDTPMGPDLYFPKKAQQVYIDYMDSLGIKVDGILIPSQYFTPSILDVAPEPKTGYEEVVTFLQNAWEPRSEVQITQDDPVPMLIRGIGIIVQLSDDNGFTRTR